MTRSDQLRSEGGLRWRRTAACGARGFTLVEVLLVVVITALVLGAVVPLSGVLIERADERAVVDRLSAGVRLATADAARRGAIVTLCVRERRGLEADLVLQFPRAVAGSGAGSRVGVGVGVGDAAAEHVVELGVDMPRGWRVESAVEVDGAAPAAPPGVGGADGGAAVTLTPVGTAFPDGRFVCLAVVATTAPSGAPGGAASGAGKDAAEEKGAAAVPRLSVAVDALNGRVSVTAIKEEAGVGEPAEAAPPPPVGKAGARAKEDEPAAGGGR